jgi:hypothetical protein
MARRFSLLKIPLRLLPHSACAFTSSWRFQINARSASLGKPNGNRLLRRTCAVFAFPDVVHFLANKFAGLRAGRLSLFFILVRSFNDFIFRHFILLKFGLWNF